MSQQAVCLSIAIHLNLAQELENAESKVRDHFDSDRVGSGELFAGEVNGRFARD